MTKPKTGKGDGDFATPILAAVPLGGLAALLRLSVREGNRQKKPRSLKAAKEGTDAGESKEEGMHPSPFASLREPFLPMNHCVSPWRSREGCGVLQRSVDTRRRCRMDSSRPLRSRRKDAKRSGPEEVGIHSPVCVFPVFLRRLPLRASARDRLPLGQNMGQEFLAQRLWGAEGTKRVIAAFFAALRLCPSCLSVKGTGGKSREASKPQREERIRANREVPKGASLQAARDPEPPFQGSGTEVNGVASINCTFQTFGSRASRCIVGKCIILVPLQNPLFLESNRRRLETLKSVTIPFRV